MDGATRGRGATMSAARQHRTCGSRLIPAPGSGITSSMMTRGALASFDLSMSSSSRAPRISAIDRRHVWYATLAFAVAMQWANASERRRLSRMWRARNVAVARTCRCVQREEEGRRYCAVTGSLRCRHYAVTLLLHSRS